MRHCPHHSPSIKVKPQQQHLASQPANQPDHSALFFRSFPPLLSGNSHFLAAPPPPFQETYYYLLQRYLESACVTGCESRGAYLHLIGRLQDLHRINQSHIQVGGLCENYLSALQSLISHYVTNGGSVVQVLVALNPRQVEPLLIEIFDLNPKGGGGGGGGGGASGGNGITGNNGELVNRT